MKPLIILEKEEYDKLLERLEQAEAGIPTGMQEKFNHLTNLNEQRKIKYLELENKHDLLKDHYKELKLQYNQVKDKLEDLERKQNKEMQTWFKKFLK